jgi:hypothetical protein
MATRIAIITPEIRPIVIRFNLAAWGGDEGDEGEDEGDEDESLSPG